MLYQTRARKALPILVRQAASRHPIFYEDLAAEMGMTNPRNLNYVLGSVGTTLNELSQKRKWGRIPHLQSLVINKTKKLPGRGFDGFLAEKGGIYRKLSPSAKRNYLNQYWYDIYAYPYWNEILEECGLSSASSKVAKIVENAKTGRSAGGGEGEEHRYLKNLIANDPTLLGLPTKAITTKEAPLPSGDKIDVLFETQNRRAAVEVKSHISNDVDLIRGLFQCVKYRAVMEAERGLHSGMYAVDVFLVVGRPFPATLYPIRHSLGIEVVEIADRA